MTIGILLRGSSIGITQSWFEGNKVGLGGVIYGELGSDITIFNTTFVNNRASSSHYCNTTYCFVYTGGIVYNSAPFAAVDTNLVISHSTFTNNSGHGTGYILSARYTNVSISHSDFVSNDGSDLIIILSLGGMITSIDNSKFINNTGLILRTEHKNVVNITHCGFVNNTALTGSLVYIDAIMITISLSEFFNNRAGYYAVVEIRYTTAEKMMLQVENTSLISHNEFVSIDHSKFINNTRVLAVQNTSMSISHSEFVFNSGLLETYNGMMTSIDHSKFINNTRVLTAQNTSVSISHSEFVFNSGLLVTYNGMMTSIDHSKFINNTGQALYARYTNMVSITHSEFVDNTVTAPGLLVYMDGNMITVKLNEFINNRAGTIVYTLYYTTTENFTNNVFIDNSAAYDVLVHSTCRPGSSLSLGSYRCIPCSATENWYRNLIGIVIADFIAGIVLVILMLALNMTVAVGTLNGILFYAHIVAANTENYFLPFTTPNFVTVFISWLNFDIGFDVCFFVGNEIGVLAQVYKTLLQLAFPIYIIFLVIIVIVASKYSNKFAKIIGKGNPVAVLATMILLSYTKLLNAVLTSLSVSYLQPAYGSRNLDVSRLQHSVLGIKDADKDDMAIGYFSIVMAVLILLLCFVYTALVFSWQWLLRYQDKLIFKWVRYQRLHHFLEPYYAPYTTKYRYWTGLLLIVRAFLYIIPILSFSFDPRVDLISTIFIVGGLILLKGVTANRVYKNWLLDVMETAIYFNLVAFSALTWYNLDFGGNQVAVAYTSVMIMFILLLGVSVFHVLCYTRLYKCSFVQKAFKRISSNLMNNKPKQNPPRDAPEELDGFQLERTVNVARDRQLPAVTRTVVEIQQQTQNQEEEM